VDLKELSRKVSAELDTYVYVYPEGMVGRPWNAEKIEAQLREFRATLIEPYLATVVRRDTIEQINLADPPQSRCAVVADDGRGNLLAFDLATAEFLLVSKGRDHLESYGVNGDAVGCFMAR
jgi:hypothetical protein